MQRRKAVLTTLAGLCSLGVLLLSSRLPDLVFRYQDRQVQTQSAFTEGESLTLTLDQTSGISFAEKLRVAQQQDIQTISLADSQMSRPAEEAETLASKVLDAIVGGMGYEPWWQGDAVTIGVYCFAWMENSTGSSFRVWSFVWSDTEQKSYANLILDDETGLPLSVYCEDDSLAWEIAGRWASAGDDSKALGSMMDEYANQVFLGYFQTIQDSMAVEGDQTGSGIEGDVYWSSFQLSFRQDEAEMAEEREAAAPEQFNTNSSVEGTDGDSGSCIVTVCLMASGFWAINW